MATFQITGPDGKKYRVTGESPEGAMSALRKMLGRGSPASGDLSEYAKGQTHPEFDPANVPGGVPGYNAETGMVRRQVSPTQSFMTGASDTASYGLADEGSAALISALERLPGRSGATYDEVLSDQRGMAKASREQNPKSHVAGQIVGALLQGLATRGQGFMPNATSLGGKMAGGALTGGAAGGTYGYASGEGGARNRILEALKAGAAGLVIGGTLPAVAEGAKSGYRAIINRLVGKPAAKSVNATPQALRVLERTVDADGSLGPQGQANMAKAGPDAMLVDAGPTARQALDTSIQRAGPGAVTARQAIDARVARGSQAMTGALDDTLGKPQGVETTRAAIRTGSAAARGNAYDDAYKAAIDYADPRGMQIEDWVRNRVPGSVIRRANELMRVRGEKSGQILAKIADDGSVTFETLPDVRQLDYITRALNDLADSGEGAGAMGGQNAIGQAYQNLSRNIRGTLRELVPEYGVALDTAADPISRSKAVQFGAEMLRAGTTREQVADFVDGMSKAERAALAQGLRSQIDDAMANVGRTVSDDDVAAREAMQVIKNLSSRGAREKLALAIGKEQADTLLDEADRIAQTFNLRADLTTNSKTYARQAMERRISDTVQPGVAADLVSGKPINATQRALQSLTGNTPEALRAKEDLIYAEVADLLTRPQSEAQSIYGALNRIGASDRAAEMMGNRIVKALTGQKWNYPAAVAGYEQTRR